MLFFARRKKYIKTNKKWQRPVGQGKADDPIEGPRGVGRVGNLKEKKERRKRRRRRRRRRKRRNVFFSSSSLSVF
jgi:hypothetical protein